MSQYSATSTVHLDTIPDGYIGIYDEIDLNIIRNNPSGNYILMEDIDLSSIDNWTPIDGFSGILDGNGYKIKNLKINSTDENAYIGLFGQTSGCEIKNLGLEDIDIRGNGDVGGLVGFATNVSIISNCYVTGTIITDKTSIVGGLTGTTYHGVEISNCYTNCKIIGYGTIGGIIGDMDGYTTMSNCYSIGNCTEAINGDSSDYHYTSAVGGLAGNGDGIISNCYTAGTIKGSYKVGGLVGSLSSIATISNCYTTANIMENAGSSSNYMGGILFGKGDNIQSTNVLGNIDKSTIKNAIGTGSLAVDSSNTTILNNDSFLTSPTWDDFDDTIWDKSTYPPTLKNMPFQNTSNPDAGTGSGDSGTGSGDSGTGSGDSGTGSGNSGTGSGNSGTGSGDSGTGSGDSGTGSGNSGTGSGDSNINTYTPLNKYIYGGSREFRIQIGAGSDDSTNAIYFDTGIDLSILEVDLSSVESSLESIYNIKAALNFVSQKITDIGITQNRLESIANTNATRIENLSSALSTIINTDIAEESVNYTKMQIAMQTTSALIAQMQNAQNNLLLRLINSLG